MKLLLTFKLTKEGEELLSYSVKKQRLNMMNQIAFMWHN